MMGIVRIEQGNNKLEFDTKGLSTNEISQLLEISRIMLNSPKETKTK